MTQAHGADRRSVGRRASSFAALDLGTNNCRLLVAQPSQGGFRVVDAFSRIVRLGEGLSRTDRLANAAIERTLAALRVCAGKLRRHDVASLRAVATEACRRAANCREFLAEVHRDTGIEIEIISAQEEARLALAGCAPLLDRGVGQAVVFDIGGGSTEVMWLSVPRSGPPALADHISVPLGVVTLSERYGGDRVSDEAYQEMIDVFRGYLEPFDRRYGIAEAVAAGRVQMLGTSGTVTTVAGIHFQLPRYDRSRVDGATIEAAAARAICRDLQGMDFHARSQSPCIGRERADLVVAGCAVLEAILDTWAVPRLRIADRGVREGILVELIGTAGRG
ncbi:MAG TPA: Ppx/GppA phosphatase family protein [Alphaproteobacteria bacterium]|nr:Ppx/GppA phosphatase family protein [Alphaproteobacteria bacterium]